MTTFGREKKTIFTNKQTKKQTSAFISEDETTNCLIKICIDPKQSSREMECDRHLIRETLSSFGSKSQTHKRFKIKFQVTIEFLVERQRWIPIGPIKRLMYFVGRSTAHVHQVVQADFCANDKQKTE